MRSLSYDVLPSMAMVLQTIDTSNNPDFTSILRVEDKIFSITHYESPTPGVAYLTELEQDKKTGKLSVCRLRSSFSTGACRSPMLLSAPMLDVSARLCESS